jgi:hypothetical protein
MCGVHREGRQLFYDRDGQRTDSPYRPGDPNDVERLNLTLPFDYRLTWTSVDGRPRLVSGSASSRSHSSSRVPRTMFLHEVARLPDDREAGC